MRYEARLLGGPADTEVFAIQGLRPEIKVARPGNAFWRWGDVAPLDIRPLPIDEHVYRPVRAVVFYEHAEVISR